VGRVSPVVELTTDDLRGELVGFSTRPERWRGLVQYDAAQRTYALVHRGLTSEIYVVSWMPGHDTGFHDHDESVAAIAVLEGAIHEERLCLEGAVGGTYGKGSILTVPRSAIHRVRHAGEAPSVTMHAYSPPHERVGTYEVEASGTLLRHAQAADTPLSAAG